MGTGRLGRIFGVDFTAGSGGEWVIMVDPPAKGGSTVRMIRIDPGGSGEGIVHTHVVPTVGKTSLAALMARDDFKVGWARLPDDSDVIYLYGGTDGFGYAINVACDWCSEWGYAPFDPQGPDDSSSVEESAVVDALSASEGGS